ncbi:MAG: ComF family protein [Clostridia bacterium]|nr:ComF family protein [Clostridia bacterium]
MLRFLREARKTASDAIFAKNCILCANRTDGNPVCKSCDKLLDGDLLKNPIAKFKTQNGDIIKCASLYNYNTVGDTLKRFLFFIKQTYNGDALDYAAKKFSYPLGMLALPENTVIVNVPRSTENYDKYGFDQTYEFSRRVKYYCGKKYIYSNLLKRKRGTKEQKKLSGADRKINASGSIEIRKINLFVLKKRLERLKKDNPDILIADDMITTGSSVEECVNVIRTVFPKSEIFAASLARNDIEY